MKMKGFVSSLLLYHQHLEERLKILDTQERLVNFESSSTWTAFKAILTWTYVIP